ncbi:MAG: DUF6607 family protein [Candidatus Rokuibacteriota bacterium]
MRRLLAVLPGLVLAVAVSGLGADAADDLDRGLGAVRSLAGCYLVDYSYVEVESLKPGYARDGRVYDVNRDKSAKEWITAEVLSPRRIRLQRILFLTDLAGAIRDGSLIKHQSEDWEHDAPFLYDFVAPRRWKARDLRATPGLWTRRVTNLDDGLRYQCAARWTSDTAYAEWTCSSYAPIPGRETRDMRRSDYDTLDRTTRIVAYGQSWLERQDNVKTVHRGGARSPLAREVGKNWSVRLPESECEAARAFAGPRQAFWTVVREVWDEVLNGASPFVEKTPAGQPPRFVKMYEVEEDYVGRDLTDPSIRQAARERILKVIEAYRDPAAAGR